MNGAILKALIIEKGHKVGDVAKACNMTISQFSAKLSGRTEFKYSQLKAIIGYLNLTPDDINKLFAD